MDMEVHLTRDLFTMLVVRLRHGAIPHDERAGDRLRKGWTLHF